MIVVVNMIPRSLSGETNQDSEPNLAVNLANPMQIAGSAFTPDALGGRNAPIYVSNDGGNTWLHNSIVPSQPGSLTGTGDITVRFSGTTNTLYAGILRRPGGLRLNILRTTNFLGPAPMTVLVDRQSVDQPYVQATTVGGNDRVYVGNNDFGAPGGRTATIDQSFNANVMAPVFNSVRIEQRATSGQDGPPIRPAIHSDGTIYGIFYGWRAFDGSTARTDIVVVRDDNGGIGAIPFTALVDVDGLAGIRVVQKRTVPWANFSQPTFGQERFVGSNITIAVDPTNSSTVYIAWADRVGNTDYTLHVRRSLDRGVTWSNDLRTITNATNPALAINSNGTVGFLYQQITGAGADQRWVTRLELTDDAFTSVQDFVLATVLAMTPAPQFIPYIGDYVHLMTVGTAFYGIFSANNTPDMANFPQGVIYQRNADFATHTLLDNADRPVPVSIDPFFFRVEPEQIGGPMFEYAAKLVCGIQKDPEDMRLARGFYATSINIHNPNDDVKFFKKLALTFPPEEQRPGEVMRIAEDALGPDEALSVDCMDVQRRLFPNGFPANYIEGFVVIQSPASLDVTAVYTTAALDEEGRVTTHSSIDVEQIRERRKGADREPADLIPVPDASGSFCRIRDGNLVVTVRNQGAGAAGASTTTVEFAGSAPVSQATPPLAAGAATDLLFPIPPGCFSPDCGFRIIVDSTNVVAETNEGNNTATGICLG